MYICPGIFLASDLWWISGVLMVLKFIANKWVQLILAPLVLASALALLVGAIGFIIAFTAWEDVHGGVKKIVRLFSHK